MEDPPPTHGPEVPPVRTIVLDRAPVPVAPPVRERNPLRGPAPSTAGPERLALQDLSIAYAGKRRSSRCRCRSTRARCSR